MPVIRNEQDVKQKSQFLKYDSGDNGNTLILLSHLYQIDSHFIKSINRSVACQNEECMYCAAGYPLGSEYNYRVDLNGEIGFLNIKGSVFFAIQKIAKVQKKDIRQMSWTVIKVGDGLKTEYTTSKDDNLATEDYEKINEEIESNTDKLADAMKKHEESLETNYTLYLGEIKDQHPPKATGESSVRSRVKEDETQEPFLADEEEDEKKN